MRLDDDFAAPGASAGAGAGSQRGAQDRRGGGSNRDARGNGRREPEASGAMAAAFAKLKR
jgi:uncharacterized protein